MSSTATKNVGPKVLITGGGGYLGYHTALVLKAAGINVLLYDLRPPMQIWEDNADNFCLKMNSSIVEVRSILKEIKNEKRTNWRGNFDEQNERSEEKSKSSRPEVAEIMPPEMDGNDKISETNLSRKVLDNEEDSCENSLQDGIVDGLSDGSSDGTPDGLSDSEILENGMKENLAINELSKKRTFEQILKEKSYNSNSDEETEDREDEGKITFVYGDICDAKGLRDCLMSHNDVIGVIHTASYGMSGTENLPAYHDITEKINLQGSRNVLEACLRSSVRALIYTSTVNVVFGGSEIINGSEEKLPYLSLSQHTDHYSRTKQVSEELILMANGRQNIEGEILQTTSLRLVGIYGPMEQRHLPRSIDTIKKGYMKALYGMDTVQDLLHINNAVQAHCKALMHLLSKERSPAVSGEAFFVTDSNPVNNVAFFVAPIQSALFGTVELPKLRVPVVLLLLLGFIMNLISQIFGKRFHLPQWALTPTEVYKTGVTHTFSIAKAKKAFGYDPMPITDKHWDEIIRSYHLKQ